MTQKRPVKMPAFTEGKKSGGRGIRLKKKQKEKKLSLSLTKRQNNTCISHLLIFYFVLFLVLRSKAPGTQVLAQIFLLAEVRKG